MSGGGMGGYGGQGGFGGSSMYGSPYQPFNGGNAANYRPFGSSSYNPMTGPQSSPQVSPAPGKAWSAFQTPGFNGQPQPQGDQLPNGTGGWNDSPDPNNPKGQTYTLGFPGTPQYTPTTDPNVLTFGGWSIPGRQIPQTQQPPQTQQQAPQQTLEQFTATLGNPQSMTQGQIYDAWQNSQRQQAQAPQAQAAQGGAKGYNFGTYGQTPAPQANQFPSAWGAQDMNFDPRSMAGKTVQPNQAWYYGYDAIGRPINNQGQAFKQYSGPADGFNISRPWYGK